MSGVALVFTVPDYRTLFLCLIPLRLFYFRYNRPVVVDQRLG